MDSFFRAVCRVGIFMICAQLLVHLKPGRTYGKYLKLLVGIMVLIQLLLPLGNLLPGAGRQTMTAYLSGLADSLEEEMRRADEEMEEQDSILEKMTLEEVRRRMEEQAAEETEEETEEEVAKGETAEETEEGTAKEGTAKGETAEETEDEAEKGMAKEEAAEESEERSEGVAEIAVESIEPILIEDR